MIPWVLVLAGALLSACGVLSLDPAATYVWARRGRDFGDLMRTYCEQGSTWERTAFLHYAAQTAGGAQVVILCPPP